MILLFTCIFLFVMYSAKINYSYYYYYFNLLSSLLSQKTDLPKLIDYNINTPHTARYTVHLVILFWCIGMHHSHSNWNNVLVYGDIESPWLEQTHWFVRLCSPIRSVLATQIAVNCVLKHITSFKKYNVAKFVLSILCFKHSFENKFLRTTSKIKEDYNYCE